MTKIISGIEPSANTPVWGRSHPASPLGGGFTVVTTRRDPNDPTGSSFNGALVLRLHEDLNNAVVDQAVVVSPKQAAQIDRKMDDVGYQIQEMYKHMPQELLAGAKHYAKLLMTKLFRKSFVPWRLY